MEDFEIDIMVWAWTWAQSVKLPLKKFTLVWATTKLSSLSSPLRDRFWNILKLDFYSDDELFKIVERSASILDIGLSDKVFHTIAKRSRWTPRIVNRLLKVVRDYHTIWKEVSKVNILEEIFNSIWIDELWLDIIDRKLLDLMHYKFAWKPVWLNTIASALWEEEATIEDVVEPYLLQIWFIERTPRGRKITHAWEKHILWMNK
jgi:Holliday junction DNA helicase RuvB